MLLDWMLPGRSGLELALELRRDTATRRLPIIMLTARNEEHDKVRGLDTGTDDYLTKPFSFEELLARLEILAQRSRRAEERITKLTALDLELDLLSRKVTRAGEEIELQAREFKLLEYLLRHKGQVVTRIMLLEHVWDYHFDPQTNVIDVHISHLRRKIDKNHAKPIIETIRGAGYIIAADD